MSSHHFNDQCCYLHQIIFLSHNTCLITKLFQGVFCHDITKLLKLAQNDMVLFYFFLKCFGVLSKSLPTPPSPPTGGALALPPSPSLPQCWHLQPVPMQACGIAYAWQLNSRLSFLKSWQPCLRPLSRMATSWIDILGYHDDFKDL